MHHITAVRPIALALAGLLILGGCAGPAAPAAPTAAVDAPAADMMTTEAPMEDSTPMATEAMTDEAMTDEAMTDEAMTDEAMTDEAMTDEAMTDEAVTDEAMTDETMADETMADEAMTDETMTDETMTDEAMADETMAERPAWQTMALTDARTGESFTLADFAGKTVFVEPFATWCANCRQQLANVHAARQQAGEDVVFVALSVEPNVGSEALAAYAADTGYDLVFAAMPPEMLQSLAAQFGQTISNPPATPHFVIRPDGSTSELKTGIEGVDAILAQLSVQG